MASILCEVRMRDNAIEKPFSLFTSPNRATAIVGDLAEERQHRGSAWFWLHVFGVTIELWTRAVVSAPLRVLALTLAGCALLIAPVFGGAVTAFLFPQWIAAWFLFASVGAVFTAISLAAIARRLGLVASATVRRRSSPSRTGCSSKCWTGVIPARQSSCWLASERRRITTMTLRLP
jgi:hypothetical protein